MLANIKLLSKLKLDDSNGYSQALQQQGVDKNFLAELRKEINNSINADDVIFDRNQLLDAANRLEDPTPVSQDRDREVYTPVLEDTHGGLLSQNSLVTGALLTQTLATMASIEETDGVRFSPLPLLDDEASEAYDSHGCKAQDYTHSAACATRGGKTRDHIGYAQTHF